MSESVAIVLASGVFVGVLGALIGYAGAMHLIAGYDPDRVTDEEGLADFVGANALYVAALCVGVGVLELAAPTAGADWYWAAFAVAVAAIAIRLVYGARRYEAPRENRPG